MVKTDQEMLDKYKERIKKQNNAIKENYDRVSATLPLGTVDRIRALGLTINGVINDSVLTFLDCAEESGEEKLRKDPIPEDIEDGPNEENRFDRLKAMDWIPEKHRGIVPRPPFASSGNATWDAEIREWCEPLPFD